jgi:hypothetical protein
MSMSVFWVVTSCVCRWIPTFRGNLLSPTYEPRIFVNMNCVEEISFVTACLHPKTNEIQVIAKDSIVKYVTS